MKIKRTYMFTGAIIILVLFSIIFFVGFFSKKDTTPQIINMTKPEENKSTPIEETTFNPEKDYSPAKITSIETNSIELILNNSIEIFKNSQDISEFKEEDYVRITYKDAPYGEKEIIVIEKNIVPEAVIDFKSCELIGGSIAESYPRQCFFGNKNFIEEIDKFSENEKTICEEKNGTYEVDGMAQKYYCNTPATDAGLNCTSSNQCEGLCFSATKTCSEMTINFGCHKILENNIEVEICID